MSIIGGKYRARSQIAGSVKRLNYLDGIRGLAATYVVVSHAWDTVFTSKVTVGGPWKLATIWMGGGRYAVTVFIVVSGFSLGLTWWRSGGSWPGGPGDFLLRRGRRLVPPYLIAIAFCAPLALLLTGRTGTLFDDAIPNRWTGILSHALALQDFWWAGPAGSTAFWSLSVELHIYVAFALAMVLLRRVNVSWLPIYLAAVALEVVIQLAPRNWLVVKLDGAYLSLYAMFLLGLVAARFAVLDNAQVGDTLRRWRLQMAIAGVAGLAAFAACLRTFSFHSPVTDLVVGPVVAVILVALALGRLGWLHVVTRSRVAVWLGHCSYSLYLTHSVLLEIVWRVAVRPLRLPAPLALVGELTLGLALSLAVARVFFRWVERPFMSKRSRPRRSLKTPSNVRRAKTAIVPGPSPEPENVSE